MESAPDDLRFLRALPASADRTRISGQVMLSGDPVRPLPDVSVTLTLSGSPPSTAVTDAKGVFEVYELPRGSYTVSVRAPQGLNPDFRLCIGSANVREPVPAHCGPW